MFTVLGLLKSMDAVVEDRNRLMLFKYKNILKIYNYLRVGVVFH